ncbi:beta-carotene hydroxylase [Mucilaginibacter calamicampi]|uniref:Beta-carotene hydroxylase n=1 Tax=Mucilaginibacter calamicampi TaxID=1302352 RepID=A0ABW2YRE5_9SPHI
MQVVIYILIAIGSFLGMEGVAWLAHKYLMHGLLWNLHEDHHHKEQYGFLEHNDFFFLIFATPGIACLALGIYTEATFALYIGIGITAYGFCYFIVHDIFIHQRIKWFRNTNNSYLLGIRRAHKMHHKHLGKEHGECFGMLWVPMKYFRDKKTAA